jgi:hypothetical protein
VRSCGGDVRVTGTTKDTEVIVAGRGTKESLVRGGSLGGIRRKAVNQVGGGVRHSARSAEAEKHESGGCT